MQNTTRAFAYLDLLFSNRNKKYGAYELRARYPVRLRKAAASVLFSVCALAVAPLISAYVSPAGEAFSTAPRKPIIFDPIPDLPAKKIEPPLPPAPPAAPSDASTAIYVPPRIVPDEEADPNLTMVTIDSLEGKQIGTENHTGTVAGGDETLPTGPGGGPGGSGGEGTRVEAPAKPAGPVVIVDVQPEFPGDVRAYLASRLVYPEGARERGQDGRVVVRFVVDEEGAISDVRVAKSAASDLDAEAVRVVSGMPRWKPARLNGHAVKAYFSLPIKFTLE